jgi:hypothetical protein
VLVRDGSEGEVGQQDNCQPLSDEISHQVRLGSRWSLEAEESSPLL